MAIILEIGPIYPPALFWCTQIGRNADLLLTLVNNKWPLGIDPGGHHFVVLNVSINNTPVFFSEVVTYDNFSHKFDPAGCKKQLGGAMIILKR